MLSKRIGKIVLSTLIAAVALAIAATPLASTDTPTASVYGQVTLDGQPVNGATVTCNGNSATTSTSIMQGFYSFQLPIGKDYPITATYTSNNITYKVSDNVDLRSLTSASSSPIGLSALALQAVATPTPTPTPNPNSTATPTPSATVTPTPTPTPMPTPTPTPTAQPQQNNNNNGNSHPVATPTITPAPTPTAIPSPTADVDLSQLNTSTTQRKVFSAPKWNVDNERVTVTNDGTTPLIVKAWVGDPTNSITTTVPAGTTKVVSTAPVLTQDNQIMNVGFDAYDPSGVPVDSYKATFTVAATPAPATARSPGFGIILAALCILGAAAYLAIKKER